MIILLYSTGCPKCNVLKNKLKDKSIEYSEVTDKKLMTSLGFTQVPILEVDGKRMDFTMAIRWINEQDGGVDK